MYGVSAKALWEMGHGTKEMYLVCNLAIKLLELKFAAAVFKFVLFPPYLVMLTMQCHLSYPGTSLFRLVSCECKYPASFFPIIFRSMF